MNTKMTKQYIEFRQYLNSHQLDNFRAALKNRISDGELPKGQLKVIELGSEVKYHIYVDQDHDLLWLLGGHWVRQGEEAQRTQYIFEMEDLVRRITRGEDVTCGA
jgi:hypothetical protein